MTSSPARTGSSSSLLRSLWFVALLLIAAASALVWLTYNRHREFVENQDHLVGNSAMGVARHISQELELLKIAVGLVAEKENDLIAALRARPGDRRSERRLVEQMTQLFPEAFAVTLADPTGRPVLEDIEGRIGPVCQASIEHFAKSGDASAIALHPNPLGHHFDVIVPIRFERGPPWLMFVSLRATAVARLLANSQLYGHRLVLVHRESPTLIEVTAEGARDRLTRDINLDDDEVARIAARVPVEGSLWDVVDLPDVDVIAHNRRQLITEAAVILAGFLLLGLVRVGQIVRAERAARRHLDSLERTAAELKDSEARHRAVVDNMLDGIITIDGAGRIESFNAAAERIFGYAASEVTGRNVSMLMPEPFRSEHDGYLSNYLSTGVAKIVGIGREVTGLRKDGRTFPMDLAVSNLALADGRRFVGIVRDITERKRSADELYATTTMQRAILDAANYTIIATSPDGIIQSFNVAAERFLGYRSVEVIGKVTPAIIHDPEEVVARAEVLSCELGRRVEPGFEVFVAKARFGAPDENEWTYVRKDGSRFPVLLSVTALRDRSGEITGFLGIGRDITESKKIERLKNEFVSTVSHELRTPLTSIGGALGLITAGIGGELPPKARSLVEIALKNSERLVRLINDILDVEKIESGKMSFDLCELDLQALATQAIEMNQSYAQQYGVDLALRCDIASARVMADADRMAQVITNLISNACKFSPPGGCVTLSVVTSGDGYRVAVHDDGPGVPEQFRDRIFDKFAQADASSTRQKGGTGLGLSIVKSIIERMGGSVGYETGADGTSFFFDLPPAPPVADATGGPAGPAGEAAERPRVLVCEDDADIAKLLRMMLEAEGFEVDVALDAQSARQCLGRVRYAAMSLDLMLPDVDGIDLIGELRARDDTGDLPIVVVSARAEAGRELAGGAMNVVDWLSKPIDERRLVRALRHAVTQCRAARPRILHIEDDADVVEVVGTLLRDLAEVVIATDQQSAREALECGDYSLIILDIGLPDGSGLDLLSTIHERQPAAPVMIFSAQDLGAAVASRVAAVLVKSRSTNDQLVATIRALLDRDTEPRPKALAIPRTLPS